MVRLVLVPIGVALLGPALALSPAFAQFGWNQPGLSPQQQTALVWQLMKICAQQAIQKFPDHTPEASAKREEARLNCERLAHLPVDPQPSRHYSPPN